MDGRGEMFVLNMGHKPYTKFYLRMVIVNTPANREMLNLVVTHIGGAYDAISNDPRRNPDGKEFLS